MTQTSHQDIRRFFVEIQPRIPNELSRLEELASNLVYSWDRQVRGLFFRLDDVLWEECSHNPKIFLRRISQEKLLAAVDDPVYMQDYAKILSIFDAYLSTRMKKELAPYLPPESGLISYSCAEFGFHESLPIYSGGLGILAGDHCKTASDMGLPMVAMGILYCQGYFSQRIDGHGNQLVRYKESNFNDLPILQVKNSEGKQICFSLKIKNRQIWLQLWLAQVGHVSVYLIDSNLPQNSEQDRKITHQLYGGDHTNRLLQELVLGIGGVKAHRLLGLKPDVWHINEGHAAFQVVERCREYVRDGLDFESALELVAASTVFTTHTPVAAGHDIFPQELIREHFEDIVKELGISMERFLALGKMPGNDHGFNMTSMALRGSRFHNAVSRIHGKVASRMESYIWEDVPSEFNPMSYITNGIHVPTFLSSEWANLFDAEFGGGWRSELLNADYWEGLRTIPNHRFWSTRETLKAKMLEYIHAGYVYRLRRNGVSESKIKRMTAYLDPQKTGILTVGFARRFATYKRATLLFSNLDRLSAIINNPVCPVVFIFAGKAHPHDIPGQNLIRQIHDLSLDPRFEGKIILMEDYDIALARKMVTGVDVWLNTPIHPLEASGTSGQKAGVNGVLNLSVLDGWWAEGYNEKNGWAITAHDDNYHASFRDQEENRELLDLIENEIVPLYYDKDGHGYSIGWIRMCVEAMVSIIPRFNSQRMAMDYVTKLYSPAIKHYKQISADGYRSAQDFSRWKNAVHQKWPGVELVLDGIPTDRLYRDEIFTLSILVKLNNLQPEDLAIECLIGFEHGQGNDGSSFREIQKLQFINTQSDGFARYTFSGKISHSGYLCYAVRAYPYHPMLAHPFEVGLMKWI